MRPPRRLLALLGLAAVFPVVEAIILVMVPFRSAEGLIPQSSAVWPYDLYHDMRWVLVYHNSWLTFGLLVLGVIVLRGLYSAALVGLAWPEGVRRPAFPALVRRNLEIAAVTAVLVLPFAAYAVAASVVSLSWFLFVSLGPMLLLAPFLQRMAVGRGLWRGLPSAELLGWSLLDFVVISVAGGVVWEVPEPVTPLVAAVAGAVNGLLWNRTVRAAVLQRHVRWRRVPAVPIVVVLALATPLAAQTITSPRHETNTFTPPIFDRPLPERVRYAVILLAGHDSAYDGRPSGDPAVERFSYAGLDASGRPLPYRWLDTHRSLGSSAELLAAQVDAVHRRTGRPIALVGESEGAMVARRYVGDRPDPRVQALAMFSPLVRAGRTYYPPRDASTGWGLAAGWVLRGMFAVTQVGRTAATTPDEPFIRSLMDEGGPFYRLHMLCPVPGVREIAFLPTVTAAEAPPAPYIRIPAVETPSFHGGFLGRPVIEDQLIDFLAGEEVNVRRREFGLLQRLGAGWHAPSLALRINPVWEPIVPPGLPAFSTGYYCRPLRQPG
ncbi:hypothetical protein GA0074692_3388 [Micromonospora pallida]|uniref:Alpha/beta hydrolase family protein n=1 Tax=Micromonospora pallida TaxID=145854 RepID=A0A1C6STQ5_9ACTN|nr:hypothetical protein [Micromonospora pallida]SCL32722.1 hypothetical protein GA0074692_3388 [Micromonospora pallida]